MCKLTRAISKFSQWLIKVSFLKRSSFTLLRHKYSQPKDFQLFLIQRQYGELRKTGLVLGMYIQYFHTNVWGFFHTVLEVAFISFRSWCGLNCKAQGSTLSLCNPKEICIKTFKYIQMLYKVCGRKYKHHYVKSISTNNIKNGHGL